MVLKIDVQIAISIVQPDRCSTKFPKYNSIGIAVKLCACHGQFICSYISVTEILCKSICGTEKDTQEKQIFHN
ncbi:hypothetical protein D3C86_1803760 [compost metagenome]